MASVDESRDIRANVRLFRLCERRIRQALFADDIEGPHLDWDFVKDAYEIFVGLAERTVTTAPSLDSQDVHDLLSEAADALDVAMSASVSDLTPVAIEWLQDVRGRLQRMVA